MTDPSAQRRGEEQDKDAVQLEAASQGRLGVEGGDVAPDTEQAIQASRGRGEALPDALRASMESAFGADFSGVRVHTGPDADALNDSMSARAFTTGQDIFFKKGEYSPETSGGKETLAHELTHVVQQKSGRIGPIQRNLKSGLIAGAVQRADTETKPAPEYEGQGINVAWARDLPKLGIPAGFIDQNSDPKDAIYDISIAVDKEAKWTESEFFREAAVGHAWVIISSPVANVDDLSFGFWPRQWRLIDADTGAALTDTDQEEVTSGGFDASKFWKSVDGEVRSPDEFHTPKGLKSKQVKFEGVMSAMEYASKMKDEAYNLLSYNCTTFAREMYKIGTGSAAPSAGLLIEDPNTLYNSIWREAKIWGTKGAEVT
ncbi:MAG: DUF4157 domain-containing protein [Chloroflexi bacterium]|nr:DUF4157 domain-containing protein [Chloroflexota bacterium]